MHEQLLLQHLLLGGRVLVSSKGQQQGADMQVLEVACQAMATQWLPATSALLPPASCYALQPSCNGTWPQCLLRNPPPPNCWASNCIAPMHTFLQNP